MAKRKKNQEVVPMPGMKTAESLSAGTASETADELTLQRGYVQEMMSDFTRPRGGIEERIEMDIARHRKGWGRFVLTDRAGKALTGAKITLKQMTHEFLFGCNLFKLGDFKTKQQNARFERYFKQVFNHGTVPFYWDTLEPEPGVLRFGMDSSKIDRRPPTDYAVDWCLENGIRPKGHWLFCDNFVPRWLPSSPKQIMILLEKRIARLAERYGEKVTIWDAVNEAFSNPRWFSKAMGWSVTAQDYVYQVFKLAEKYFPNYTELVYNDGNWISYIPFSRDNSPMYLLAKNLQDRGVRLGGLGIQFHMYGTPQDFADKNAWRSAHRYFDPYHQFQVLDQYGMLNIPIHMTETSLPTFPQLPRKEGEKLQADMLRHFFRMWFSHPKMQSIVLWNFADKTAYGAESAFDAGILDKDLNPKPAFLELDRLVNHEWHTECTVETDERGIADWNGFYGGYDMEITLGRTKLKQKIQLSSDGCNEIRMELN